MSATESPPPGRVPLRRCLGCGRSVPKAQLLRLVVRDGQLEADPDGLAAGRGAYVHPDAGCWSQAVGRQAFSRALRAAVIAPQRAPFG